MWLVGDRPKSSNVAMLHRNRTDQLVAIEVKSSQSLSPRDLRGIGDFAEATGRRFHAGIVLYGGDTVVPFSKTVVGAPIAELWA